MGHGKTEVAAAIEAVDLHLEGLRHLNEAGRVALGTVCVPIGIGVCLTVPGPVVLAGAGGDVVFENRVRIIPIDCRMLAFCWLHRPLN